MIERSPRIARPARGRWTVALLVLVGALLVGPMQSESAAGMCVPPPDRREPVSALAGSTGSGFMGTRIHWVRWHKRVVYGDQATLEGQVVTDGGAIPNATVDLFARDAGAEEWSLVQSAMSDPETAVFSFACLEPTVTTEYRAVYDGTLYYAGSKGERKVGVARRIPDAMKQVADQRFRFSGAVRPAYKNRPVLLQRKDCATCRWSTVARKNSNARSRWRFTIDTSTYTGRRWFRATVRGEASYVRSRSQRVWRLRS